MTREFLLTIKADMVLFSVGMRLIPGCRILKVAVKGRFPNDIAAFHRMMGLSSCKLHLLRGSGHRNPCCMVFSGPSLYCTMGQALHLPCLLPVGYGAPITQRNGYSPLRQSGLNEHRKIQPVLDADDASVSDLQAFC